MLNRYDFSAIRTLRKRRKLTIQQLADLSGLTFPTLASIETNKSLPSLASLDQIAAALDIPVTHLLLLCQRFNPVKKRAEILDIPDPIKDLKPEICRTVSYGGIRICLMKGKMGMTADKQWEHENVFEISYVLSGRVELVAMNKTHTLLENDTIFIDGSNEHIYRFLDDGEMLIFHTPKGQPHLPVDSAGLRNETIEEK